MISGRRRRVIVALASVVALLAGAKVLIKFGPPHTGLVVGPACALALVAKARWAGLSWEDLGLGRRSLRKGAVYAAIVVVVVAGVYGLGALLPGIRTAVMDMRYHLDTGRALVSALLVVPVGTVLLEEVAFRGVLFGLLQRHRGSIWANGFSSGLFGLWHILPSLRLDAANATLGALVGRGGAGQVLVVGAVVGFTALAGVLLCELRRRSGSLLAAAGLHWATNGLGVLLATLLWTWQAS